MSPMRDYFERRLDDRLHGMTETEWLAAEHATPGMAQRAIDVLLLRMVCWQARIILYLLLLAFVLSELGQ